MAIPLPKSEKEFSSPTYWRKFFEKCDSPFEWYGSYAQLSSMLEKHLKPQDEILQIGCGNSELAEQLWDNGFRRIRSIDIDEKVIEKQRRKNVKKRPELKFEARSAEKVGII